MPETREARYLDAIARRNIKWAVFQKAEDQLRHLSIDLDDRDLISVRRERNHALEEYEHADSLYRFEKVRFKRGA